MGRSTVTRAAGLALLAAIVLLSACAAPAQNGGVFMAPGAAERLTLAMQMGYIGFDREMVPGQVRRARLQDQLPAGEASSGRLGDYVLENGHVVASVTAIDGTLRGGRLVDLARKPAVVDGLELLDLQILGRSVVYDSLKTGFDETTLAAYVEVSGRIDVTAEGGPLLTISTRYDAAPGIEAIVVHTHIKWDRGDKAASEELPLMRESMRARNGVAPIVDGMGTFGASMGDGGGYLLRMLGEGATIVSSAGAPSLVVGVADGPAAEGDSILVSRIVSPLARADSAALAVAVARTQGGGVGDVEVRVAVRGSDRLFPVRGDLAFVSDEGARFEACGVSTRGEDSHFGASIPAGKYVVYFRNDKLSTEGQALTVEADRVAFLTLPAGSGSALHPPTAGGCISVAAHAALR